MALVIDWVIMDCLDVERMTAFWTAALDMEEVRVGPLGGRVLAPKDGSKRRLAMFPVHDHKTGKNRVHFDLRPDHDQETEVARLEGLGAQRVNIGQVDVPWVVMADPEGNEFCVLRPMTEEARAVAMWGD